MVILSSIGIYEIIRSITSIKKDSEIQNTGLTQSNIRPVITNKIKTKKHFFAYIGFSTILIIMLVIPMVYDRNTNWISSADVPTSIANGGTNYRLTTSDWIDTLNWISKNTPKDSVIASWWDYGYWITALGNRTSLADNATINQTKIESIAKMFISPEKEGLKLANDLKADYILVYVVGQKLPAFDPNSNSPIFVLGTGGDESKKHWFIRIGGFNEKDYLESNGETPKQKYWDSLLGHMMPFKSIGYFNPTNGIVSPAYQPNSIPFYVKDIKYPKGNSSQPLTLEYASSSFKNDSPGLFFGVLLYKVNDNFTMDNNNQISNGSKNFIENSTSGAKSTEAAAKVSPTSFETMTVNNKSNIITNTNTLLDKNNMTTNNTTNNTADIETSQGQIKIQFLPEVAPRHVKNFEDLAKKGFYDGVIFHRLAKGFVIQAGDPNTKNDSNREVWGTGGPGYTINQEFSNIPHERGIVSMARTMDPNSAGSQFFIVLNDSKFLDNQYTVFGKVIEGMDVVDRIANLPTNAMDQPNNPNLARINKININ
jgi:dolichyl-diphosphooligosaccharide--protein glycosyltransferase